VVTFLNVETIELIRITVQLVALGERGVDLGLALGHALAHVLDKGTHPVQQAAATAPDRAGDPGRAERLRLLGDRPNRERAGRQADAEPQQTPHSGDSPLTVAASLRRGVRSGRRPSGLRISVPD